MSALNNTTRVGKFVCGLRIKPRVDFYGSLFDFAQTLSPKFPDWETTGLQVLMMNKEKAQTLALKHDLWTFIEERPNDIDSAFRLSSEIFSEAAKVFKHQEIDRVGIRIQLVEPISMTFDEVVKAFCLKAHSEHTRKLSCFGSNLTDTALITDCELDGLKFHFEMGPIKQEQIFQRLKLRLKTDKESIPQVGIWCDVDASKLAVNTKELEPTLKSVYSGAIKYSNEALPFFKK